MLVLQSATGQPLFTKSEITDELVSFWSKVMVPTAATCEKRSGAFYEQFKHGFARVLLDILRQTEQTGSLPQTWIEGMTHRKTLDKRWSIS